MTVGEAEEVYDRKDVALSSNDVGRSSRFLESPCLTFSSSPLSFPNFSCIIFFQSQSGEQQAACPRGSFVLKAETCCTDVVRSYL